MLTFNHQFFPTAICLSIGLFGGIWLQHRWPIGRLAEVLTHRTERVTSDTKELSQIPPTKRLAIVLVGQSNAANYGDTRTAAGADVYAFFEGRLYEAVDPLPGGDGCGGSVWTRLGARLVMSKKYDAIVLAVVAQGSTRADDWAPGGSQHERLRRTLLQLQAAGLPADFILWQQGETESAQPNASGPDYLASFQKAQNACRDYSRTTHWLVAQATWHAGASTNEQIRLAQANAAVVPGTFAGPDLDQLGNVYRSDGIHFNALGLSAAAGLWLESLRPALKARSEN